MISRFTSLLKKTVDIFSVTTPNLLVSAVNARNNILVSGQRAAAPGRPA